MLTSFLFAGRSYEHKDPIEVGAGLRSQRVVLIKAPLARLAFGKCCTHAVKP